MSQGNRNEKVLVGNLIRAPRVLCIDHDSTNLGVISLSEALKIAADQGLDLIQLSNGSPPTCKIVDYGKYKYEQSKKTKEAAKKQRESISKLKEIKFHPTTDINDLKIKARKVVGFLDEGAKVKVTIVFRGWREASHRDIAMQTLNEFLSFIPNAITSSVGMEGKCLSCMVDRGDSTDDEAQVA